MSFDDFLASFSNEELRELARYVGRNEVTPDLEARLYELLQDVSMAERQRAFAETPAIVDLLEALGLRFRFPEGELRMGEEPVEPDEDVEVEESLTPTNLGIREAEPARQQRPRFEGRPDPRMGNNNIVARFPQPNIRSEFEQLETFRRNMGEDVPPQRFFEQYAQNILGQHFIITQREFVEAQQSPDSTSIGK